MRNKIKIAAALMLLGIALLFGTQAEAATLKTVKTLSPERTYKYNLDGKGKKEKLYFSMNDSGVIKVRINGKVKLKLNGGETAYDPVIQLFDINKKDGRLDMLVYCLQDSDDLAFAKLYYYSGGKLRAYKNGNLPGTVMLSNLKGKIAVEVYDPYYIRLMSPYTVKVVYKVKSGKVKKVPATVFYIQYFFAGDGTEGDWDNTYYETAFAMEVFEKASYDSEMISLEAGTLLHPRKIDVSDKNRIWVNFKTEDGDDVWLCDDWLENNDDYNLNEDESLCTQVFTNAMDAD